MKKIISAILIITFLLNGGTSFVYGSESISGYGTKEDEFIEIAMGDSVDEILDESTDVVADNTVGSVTDESTDGVTDETVGSVSDESISDTSNIESSETTA